MTYTSTSSLTIYDIMQKINTLLHKFVSSKLHTGSETNLLYLKSGHLDFASITFFLLHKMATSNASHFQCHLQANVCPVQEPVL